MVNKLFNFNFDEELIKRLDEKVKGSNNKYKDRTHFVTLAIQELLEK